MAEIDLVVNMKLRADIFTRHADRCYCTECGCDLDHKQAKDSQCCPNCKAIAPLDVGMGGQVKLLRERQRMYTSQV